MQMVYLVAVAVAGADVCFVIFFGFIIIIIPSHKNILSLAFPIY